MAFETALMRRLDVDDDDVDDDDDAATVALMTKREGEMVLSTMSECDFEWLA